MNESRWLVGSVTLAALMAACSNARGQSIAPTEQEWQANPASPSAPRALCPNATARHLARAYRLSLMLADGRIQTEISEGSALVGYVAKHKQQFARGGAVSRCARGLGSALQGTAQLNQMPDARGRLVEQWGGDVPAEVIDGAARDLQAGGHQVLGVALELLWLADVLPAVAEGDLVPFNTTASANRSVLRQYGPMLGQIQAMLEAMPQEPSPAALLGINLPEVSLTTMLRQMEAIMAPQNEELIYQLAISLSPAS